MIISFAGALFATVITIAFASLVLTIVRYGARVSQLRREMGDCREFIEMRVVQRGLRVPLAGAAPRIVLRRAQTSVPVALRAAA